MPPTTRIYLSEVTNEQLEDGMYRGLMEALDDPYSEYYTAEELTDSVSVLPAVDTPSTS